MISATGRRVMFDFKNPNQAQFYDDVMQAVLGVPGFDWRYFFYGGAIRGGKTFVCLFIFYRLALIFPGSRWHVYREDNPALESTTIPSMEKILGQEYPGCGFKWKRGKGAVQVIFSNGSKIFFKSENFKQDPFLKEMLGLETNGILLEQMEALSPKILDMAMQRLGSWYITPMPKPLLLGTFNPTNEPHVKKKIYDPWVKEELKSPWYFKQALPDDNPHVTAEQWANWEHLDEESKLVMVKGVWRFATDGKRFAYAFEEQKHLIDITTKAGKAFMSADKRLPINLVFDFNVDPITCIVVQHQGMSWAKVIKEYRLRNSDIYELLEQIKIDWAGYFLIINADASGRNRTAITKGNRSFVTIIKQELRLSSRQVQIPKRNPSVKNTRVLMNSLFGKHGDFWIASDCHYLIDDLLTVRTDEKGNIEKEKDKTKTHLFDTLRYFMWYYFKKFVPLYPVDVDTDEETGVEEYAEAA